MLTLFNIPEQCALKINVPLSKFMSPDSDIGQSVESIQWCASVKPEFTGITAVNSDIIRYDELQIFLINLVNTDFLFEVARKIYKKVKYPCLLILKYQDKFLVSTCQFDAGKVDRDNNLLHAVNFSHWIHADLLSPGASRMICEINESLNEKSDLYHIYLKMTYAIQNFRLGGTTKAHVDRLLYDIRGRTSATKRDAIMKYCTPYKKHAPLDASRATKYDKAKRTADYTYSYDYEDIWYCLMCCKETQEVIKKRKYRDIEDLVYSIDSKNW